MTSAILLGFSAIYVLTRIIPDFVHFIINSLLYDVKWALSQLYSWQEQDCNKSCRLKRALRLGPGSMFWLTQVKEESGWLLFNANSAIFQLYHGGNKLIFNEMMKYALY
jgi:hypothetical protein